MKFEECVLGVCCRKWTCKFMLSSKRVQDKEGPLCAVYYAVCTALGLPLSGFETMSYNRAQQIGTAGKTPKHTANYPDPNAPDSPSRAWHCCIYVFSRLPIRNPGILQNCRGAEMQAEVNGIVRQYKEVRRCLSCYLSCSI